MRKTLSPIDRCLTGMQLEWQGIAMVFLCCASWAADNTSSMQPARELPDASIPLLLKLS